MMRCFLCCLFALVLANSSPRTASAQASEPSASEVERARELYREGLKQFDAKRYDRAARAFRDSYQLRPHADTLYNLGAAEFRNGELAPAARHLAAYLREPTPTPPKDRDVAQKYLTQAEAKVGRLKLELNVDGARIQIDGENAGDSPLSYTWHVDPGNHSVSAERDGYERASVTATVGAGAVETVRVTLAASQSTLPGAGLGTNPPPSNGGGNSGDNPSGKHPPNGDSGVSPKTIALISGAALTAVSLGVGIGFQLRASSAQSDADDLAKKARAELNGNCPSGSATPTCSELESALDRRDESQTIRNVGFVAAGTFAVATVATYLLWPEPKKEAGKRRALSPSATLGPNSAALSLSGTF